MGLGQAQGENLAERPAQFLVGSRLEEIGWVFRMGFLWVLMVFGWPGLTSVGFVGWNWWNHRTLPGSPGNFEPCTRHAGLLCVSRLLSSNCPYQFWMWTDEPVPKISKHNFHGDSILGFWTYSTSIGFKNPHFSQNHKAPNGFQSSKTTKFSPSVGRTLPNAEISSTYLA